MRPADTAAAILGRAALPVLLRLEPERAHALALRGLRFIRHARDLGFSIEQIRELLGLWQNRRRPSRQVKALAEAHVRELDAKLHELQAMKATLEHLAHCCHGDDRPECPILDSLASSAAAASGAPKSGLRPGRSH